MTASLSPSGAHIVAETRIRPIPALFCDEDARKILDEELTKRLGEARTAVADGRVAPALGNDVFRERLARWDFAVPQPLSETLDWVLEQLSDGAVHLTHPRYFGLFNPSPSVQAELAERIVAAFNPQLATLTTSPFPVEAERHVIRAFAARAGMPDHSGGHFATGGSEANFTALVCALANARAEFVASGVMAFEGAPAIYVSEDAHLAWLKIAVQGGIGRDAVRMVPTDARGRLEPGALAAMIVEDRRAGREPVMVAATAGTTCAGMIDPLVACGRIAREHGLWFHVDAAWGGAVLVSDTHAALLHGIGEADSIMIDAHKWLATTMGCSMFLTRKPGALRQAFDVSANFMPPSDEGLDPHRNTLQWSRRFLGLRLFLALATVGWRGLAEHVERSMELAALLATELEARGWRCINESQLAVICAVPPAGYPAAGEIARGLVASGKAWVSSARFKGQEILRICMTNGRTMPSDVAALVGFLDAWAPGGQDRERGKGEAASVLPDRRPKAVVMVGMEEQAGT